MKKPSILVNLFMVEMALLAFAVQPIKSEPALIIVPDDYLTIQEAINHANNGDTVFVKNGTYYENVVVNKTISLIGEDKDRTILNATYNTESLLFVEANDVKISGFTFEGYAFQDIVIGATTGVVIVENKIIFNSVGIWVENSVNATVENNTLDRALFGLDNIGILLAYSSECRIVKNTIMNAWVDGIRLLGGGHNLIHQNLIKDNNFGIYFRTSNLNTISANTIENGSRGIYIESSSSNKILHNNFIDNFHQAETYDNRVNSWDNGFEGNYWSNYNDSDSDYDGIGDTPFFIGENNQDNYPLMGTFSDHSVDWANTTYHVNTICNSTIADFFFGVLTVYPDHVPGPPWTTSIILNVTEDAPGFCRIMIPKDVLGGEYVVTLDGFTMPPSMWRELPISNDTILYLYLTYPSGFHKILIMGTTMIPEFPSFFILPLFMIATLLAAIVYKRKREDEAYFRFLKSLTP